ncbi:MAG TPA: DUF3310 domain-containing protein [Terricaulis sp.]|nr:DUF3310 domain-containing protein [Terricaulis sp.]
MADAVHNPPHYNSRPDGMECIELVEMLPFCEGNAVKYIWRCDHKGSRSQDLAKARWYVERAKHDPTGGTLTVEDLCDDKLLAALARATGGFKDRNIASALSAIVTGNFDFALKCIEALEGESSP